MNLSENAKFLIAFPLGLVITFLAVAVFVSCLLGLCYIIAIPVSWMFLL